MDDQKITESNGKETEIWKRVNAPIGGIVILLFVLLPFLMAGVGIVIGYMGYYIGLLGAVILLTSYYFARDRKNVNKD